jgi:hypothetical protein
VIGVRHGPAPQSESFATLEMRREPLVGQADCGKAITCRGLGSLCCC